MGEKYSSNCVSIPQGPINTIHDYRICQSNGVSIPQGPINTDPFGRDTPGITLFQFRKVQLIRCQCIGKHGDVVSIPQGPINT